MAKVKVFSEDTSVSLEESINEFLKSDEVGSIIDIKFSTSAIALPDSHGIVDPFPLFAALIYYEETFTPYNQEEIKNILGK